MPFSLSSFSPEFWFAEGEPYDRSDLALNKDGKPISVWSAITQALEDNGQRATLAEELGVEDPETLTVEAVYDRIQEVNTCGTLETPVDVFIDEDGYHYLEVYDND